MSSPENMHRELLGPPQSSPLPHRGADLEKGQATTHAEADHRLSPTFSSNAPTPTTTVAAIDGKHELEDDGSRVPNYDAANPLPSHHKLNFKRRIAHYTWVWFAMTMAAAGVANVIFNIPLAFRGQWGIGLMFFFFSLVLFVFNIVMITIRFNTYRHTFFESFTHPSESLFIPASVVSFGLNLLNVAQYGQASIGGWFDTAIAVLFWIYCALAIVSSCAIYVTIWSTQAFTVGSMTPVWVFPAYPLLIVGSLTAVVAKHMATQQALVALVTGTVLQSTGFWMSMLIYSAYMYRLMTQKLPKEGIRPGMFVSVGPAAFTAAGLIKMAALTQTVFPADFLGNGPEASLILRVMADFIGSGLWGLAFWFFFVSVGAHWSCPRSEDWHFMMNWYSFIFPNSALVTSTFAVAGAFGARPLQIFGIVLAIMLALTFLWIFGLMCRALYRNRVLWPGRDEDRDEGGFVGKKISLTHKR